jgi:DNA-binding NarL/FixJ family response regulator
MVINHLEKVCFSSQLRYSNVSLTAFPSQLFVTSDAATILRELEVVHPAAKVLVLSSESMEAEVCSLFFFCREFFFRSD